MTRWRWLVASLAVHAVVYAWLLDAARRAPQFVSTRKQDVVPIKVVLGKRRPSADRQAPRHPERSEGSPKENLRSAQNDGKPAARPRTKADFLPGAEYAFDAAFNQQGQGLPGGTASQGARNASAEISGRFDIPLVFREKNPDAKSVAKLKLDETGMWFFDYVDGDPHMRAVLFEALREPANRKAVRDLMAELGTKELLVSLRQRTTISPDAQPTFHESVRLEGDKLIVERLYVKNPMPPAGPNAGSGIEIEDEHSRRAKRRDRSHLQKLQMSPAFMAPIRNRKP